ncbi:nucleoside phosphatase family-domain-containing protein [Multifurca ochricompacta]|uniref:Nucleoside phosphatase family-domain-containing protein n=1 Tax=Multifurca ochricompacta TaxID=376703 RepID=A0AAD4QQH8_9AGAM|nr:nucleoside phosphatase family-domain-containing protein [Multifurca ochricompacta]
MPPPTVADAWLNSRRFGIVVDAGSSGSRLQIYSWRDARAVRDALGPEASRSLPKVEKGTERDENWVIKVEPGISSFAGNLDDIPAYLAPLLKHAQTHIPPSLHPETPLFLLATAGMRLLSPEQQATILRTTCHFLRFHSHFRIDSPSPAGPCGSSVRIITGEEEGLFGWISVNYLLNGFGPLNSDRSTYGFLDMGGASTQIAFEPSLEEQKKAQNLMDVRLRLIGGEEISHKVFVTTWLGYGTNQARERYVGQVIRRHERSRPSLVDGSPVLDVIEDPCLPRDLTLVESPVYAGPSTAHEQKAHTLHGVGSFERCLKETSPLLNKTVPCPDAPCLFNGIHAPPIDFSVSRFIGISEYWYSSEPVFGLGGSYNFTQYERAAQEFCGKPWNEILRKHEELKKEGQLTRHAEGEGGRIMGLEKWNDKMEISRLQMQCFKAAWIINVLHEGLGMPRIVDPGGNDTIEADEGDDYAKKKGFWRPWFQSMESVGDMAISWTLGKMVLEASKEIPPRVKNSRPLPDPVEGILDVDSSPIQPSRPPFHFGLDAIDDHISSHLPPSLTRHSLGFPLAGVLSCFFMALCVSVIAYRLRRYIRICVRRLTPFSPKRDRDLADLSMEQGGSVHDDGPNSSPYSLRTPSVPSLWCLRPIAPLWHRHRIPQHINQIFRPRQVPPSPARPSPIRRSPPSIFAQQSDASTPTSTSASPTLGTHDDYAFLKNADAGEASSISLYSRSRNSSTISLSVLIPRQPLSRTGSALHLH